MTRIKVTAPKRATYIYIMRDDGTILRRKGNTGFAYRGRIANPQARKLSTLVSVAWTDGMRVKL